ncbi:MAG: DUF4282 domain-containing protein [Desulfovibrio sp.]|nr:MAG: DUF4282 domain-containing protein [Desulfovibrio sp.]
MGEFLSFRKFITPVFIQIIFWILVAIVVIGGLIAMVQGLNYGSGMMAFQGFLMIILGPLFVRIYCEIVIIFFRMYDVLEEIRDKP